LGWQLPNIRGYGSPLVHKKEKKRVLYIWKIIEPIFWSIFHHHSIMANPSTLSHLVFIMILSMGTQRSSIHLCTVISLSMNRKHVVWIADCLLESKLGWLIESQHLVSEPPILDSSCMMYGQHTHIRYSVFFMKEIRLLSHYCGMNNDIKHLV